LRAVAVDINPINVDWLTRFFQKHLRPVAELPKVNISLLSAFAGAIENHSAAIPICSRTFGEESVDVGEDLLLQAVAKVRRGDDLEEQLKTLSTFLTPSRNIRFPGDHITLSKNMRARNFSVPSLTSSPLRSQVPQASCKSPFRIPLRTVSGIVNEYSLPFVDLLHVDTEGFDPFVLFGAEELLVRHRVGVVVFELWSLIDMEAVFVNLLERHGYRCYIPPIYHREYRPPYKYNASNISFPFLVPVNFGCFREELRLMHSWSNAVCHLDNPEYTEAFRSLVETYVWQVWDAKPPLCYGFEKAMKLKSFKTKTRR
jgi:hypothetical protein